MRLKFLINCDAENDGGVLLNENDVETVVLLSKNFSKAKDYVEIGIDAEDYFRIKNSGKESK
jgi:hypothetical protein